MCALVLPFCSDWEWFADDESDSLVLAPEAKKERATSPEGDDVMESDENTAPGSSDEDSSEDNNFPFAAMPDMAVGMPRSESAMSLASENGC